MRWYVFDGEIKKGPYGAADIREMLRQGSISLDTFVMREGSPLKRKLLDVVEGLAQDLVAENGRAGDKPVERSGGGASDASGGGGPGEFGGRLGNTAIAPVGQPQPRPAAAFSLPQANGVPPGRSTFSTGPLSNSRPSAPAPAAYTAPAPAALAAPAPAALAAPANGELERLRAENERLLRERQKILEKELEKAQAAVQAHAQVQGKASAPAPLQAQGKVSQRAVAGRDAPEHQRARTESESRLKASGEKIRWQKNRVNMSSDLVSDGAFGRSDTVFDAPAPAAAPAAPGGGRGAPAGASPPSPRGQANARPRARGPSRAKSDDAPFPLVPIVIAGLVVFLLVIVGFAKRMSNMKESISASRVAREDAEWLATQALMKADQARAQKEQELRELARRQKAELRKATAEARKEARRALLESRKRKEAAQKAAAARAQTPSRAARPEARIVPPARKPKKPSTVRRNPAPVAARAPSGPPAPGWPSTVVSKGPQLRANAFKVVSVVGIRVNALPSAGCSPCQTRGTLADGTPVTLVAPTLTPFVPAKMAGARRVAVKALVQASGEFRLLVQSAIKN